MAISYQTFAIKISFGPFRRPPHSLNLTLINLTQKRWKFRNGVEFQSLANSSVGFKAGNFSNVELMYYRNEPFSPSE